ncbi:MAG: head-tail connector protein [Defluviitaleaceae bacterium]|nr:head-tail connector protein [Defluviitaleaceae bacterium]
MITLAEALDYLKLEADDIPDSEKSLIEGLAAATTTYLQNATGFPASAYENSNQKDLATLFCRMLLADWYDNRQTVGNIGAGTRAILTQLQNCPPIVSEPDTQGCAAGVTP